MDVSQEITVMWRPQNPLMINNYWFMQWFGVVRQLAITYNNPNLCRHTASPGHNESEWCRLIIFEEWYLMHIWSLISSFNAIIPKSLLPRSFPWQYKETWINFLRPADAFIISGRGPSLVQIVAWSLFGGAPLPGPLMIHRQFIRV